MNARYQLPPQRRNAEGRERGVGVELEMSAVSLDRIADCVQRQFGGEIETHSRFEQVVRATRLGDFRVEFDARWLHDRKNSDEEDVSEWRATLERYAEDALLGLAERVVPAELIAPPVPLSALPDFDPLVHALRDAGAAGTNASVLYAFGLQFNAELPALDADTIRRHLQAFACLSDWLRSEEKVPPSRRLSPFIRDFPKAYLRLLMRPDYAPELPRLIDDHLEHNPTRNRTLDMLPLFALLDEPRVRAVVPEQKINKRPTFHYRLPNSLIDEADWSLHAPWNRWVAVETLAADERWLSQWMAAWREHDAENPLDFVAWRDTVARWLAGLSSP